MYKTPRFILNVLVLLYVSTIVYSQNQYTNQSVLSEGKWVKFKIEETGIYKITYAELKKMGFSDPSKVAVFGYGGNILNESLNATFYNDLPNVSIYQGPDYILFYGLGVIRWYYSNFVFQHENNPYSTYGCYFLTDSQTPNIIQLSDEYKYDAATRVTTFDDYLLHEKELVSVNNSGRELYGESFVNSKQSFPFGKVDGLIEGTGYLDYCFIANPNYGTKQLYIAYNGNQIMNKLLPNYNGSASLKTYCKGTEIKGTVSFPITQKSDLTFDLTYSSSGDRTAFLNFLRINFQRQLKNYGEPYMFFRNTQYWTSIAKYIIENANSNTMIWRVSNPISPIQMTGELLENSYSFINTSIQKDEFVLIQTEQTFPSITAKDVSLVPNQNLHAITNIDYVILAPPAFKSEALRLAKAHEAYDTLKTLVVSPEEIYNEFSSGTPDATAIRNFMKMLYDQDNSRKYLLLFGDGTYDNRFLSSAWKNISQKLKDNFILTYQTKNSLDDASEVYEDYFGQVGYQPEPEVGVGRFPVQTITDAKNVVDKTITYIQPSNIGKWKNEVLILGDDGGGVDSYDNIFTYESISLSKLVLNNMPQLIVNQGMFDKYKKNNAGQSTYPDVIKLIKDKLQSGILYMHYIGHGNERSLSDENVYTQYMANNLTYPHPPIFITASCDFCPFDGSTTTAGEDVFLKKGGGGIALFTTTRVAINNDNAFFNTNIINNIVSGNRYRLGDLIVKSKGSMNDVRKMGICLIGDPAIKLPSSDYNVQLTHINNEVITDKTIYLKSQQKVSLKGSVNINSTLSSNFNGLVYISIFDNLTNLKTYGNFHDPIPYQDYPNLIYSGSAEVKNGEFTVSFIVPKDIQYSSGTSAKMSFYAVDETNYKEASGYFTNYIVNGTDTSQIKDTTPPEIRLACLNDTTFRDGGKVNATPYFMAKVWDESGINITGSSIGHDITLTIDGSPYKTYNLNAYYSSSFKVDGEGEIGFSIAKLDTGMHTAQFKVWDVMNNPAAYNFSFEVVDGLRPKIAELIAFPSPTKESATFQLIHNRIGSNLNVKFEVFDITGRLQWNSKEITTSASTDIYSIKWDLYNSAGGRLRPGVYLYRAIISSANSKEATETKKMIILGH
ncbi:type IX secretion system sortase PorU [Parabacteroides sp. Marseille-P3160]|uniref:type IX secretion system sortase PorU n=1 Tax=Parabacteroides sp. Marseille-P3160 TaxID=1917887 RepID=UPI0009BB560A|nr:type IX secretion system sortase PorU [Parabacteroides sp. Marseille-P3160]